MTVSNVEWLVQSRDHWVTCKLDDICNRRNGITSMSIFQVFHRDCCTMKRSIFLNNTCSHTNETNLYCENDDSFGRPFFTANSRSIIIRIVHIAMCAHGSLVSVRPTETVNVMHIVWLATSIDRIIIYMPFFRIRTRARMCVYVCVSVRHNRIRILWVQLQLRWTNLDGWQ